MFLFGMGMLQALSGAGLFECLSRRAWHVASMAAITVMDPALLLCSSDERSGSVKLHWYKLL